MSYVTLTLSTHSGFVLYIRSRARCVSADTRWARSATKVRLLSFTPTLIDGPPRSPIQASASDGGRAEPIDWIAELLNREMDIRVYPAGRMSGRQPKRLRTMPHKTQAKLATPGRRADIETRDTEAHWQ